MSREKILIRTSWVSTIGNAILSASKIIVGLFAGSLAVLGDGIDSATDVIISIVMIFTARIMNRPPSKKYVFGYEKAEGIATKILSLVIFLCRYANVVILRCQHLFGCNKKRFLRLLRYMLLYSLSLESSCWPCISINKERELIALY